MKYTSIFKSVSSYAASLISRFTSISKDSAFIHPGETSPTILKESKDIAKARKTIKESLYSYIESQYSQLFTGDTVSISSNGKDITFSPEEYEIIISKFYSTISPMFMTFISERKMASTMAKYACICLSGVLIGILNEKNK